MLIATVYTSALPDYSHVGRKSATESRENVNIKGIWYMFEEVPTGLAPKPQVLGEEKRRSLISTGKTSLEKAFSGY